MHFDKAFVIGLPKYSDKRLERCFRRFKKEGVHAELWEGLYGLEIFSTEHSTSLETMQFV